MDQPDGEEKRKRPRSLVNMLVDFQVTGESKPSRGQVINASEVGLLIQTFKDIPTGEKVRVEVSFSKGLERIKFHAVTEIIWKDIYIWEDWETFQYGLKFVQISEEDYSRLKEILRKEI
jgi:hypothetical protein